MHKLYFFTIALSLSLFTNSCSKKHHPGKTATVNNDSVATKKIIKAKRNYVAPTVIIVNDEVAHKSLDGRLYYDLQGHRYWKNYKNGMYYLYNKSMYNNDAFKPK